jgi:hypothetical protein
MYAVRDRRLVDQSAFDRVLEESVSINVMQHSNNSRDDRCRQSSCEPCLEDFQLDYQNRVQWPLLTPRQYKRQRTASRNPQNYDRSSQTPQQDSVDEKSAQIVREALFKLTPTLTPKLR